MRPHVMAILAGFAGAWTSVMPANAEPLRIALIVGNAHYATLPELTSCTASAAAVRDALRAKGFEIIERSDLGRGQFDAAIGTLARRAAASPPAIAALYYCGYALEFNGRSFLLPVSASIARDNDILTQGIISKSLVDSLGHAAESAGFVLLDAFQPPGASASGMARLVEQIRPGPYAVIGAANEAGSKGPTAAAQAVRDELASDKITLERFVRGVRVQLAKASSVAAYVIAATGPTAYLAGAPAEPAVPAASPEAAATPPPVPAAVQPPPPEPRPAAAPPPPPAPPLRIMVGEDHMSDPDRRLIQAALATMGYYSGRIDGLFGPETRAAIRRFQFEIKAELTGYLTAEQATKLVNSVR